MTARIAVTSGLPPLASIAGAILCVAMLLPTNAAPGGPLPEREVIVFLDAAAEAERRILGPMYSIAINLTFDLGVANQRTPSVAGQQVYERLRAWRDRIETPLYMGTHCGRGHGLRGRSSAACTFNVLAKDCL
ncbi:MAG: hypothetical protein H0T46_24435 [Deltaproteobacteria bacterium]|nr:hypothetical protein [Deltaproteobacteria bacterium]